MFNARLFYRAENQCQELPLRESAKAVYCYLSSLADCEVIQPSRKAIAEKLGYCLRTITRSVAELIEAGLIRTRERYCEDSGYQRSNIYEITSDEINQLGTEIQVERAFREAEKSQCPASILVTNTETAERVSHAKQCRSDGEGSTHMRESQFSIDEIERKLIEYQTDNGFDSELVEIALDKFKKNISRIKCNPIRYAIGILKNWAIRPYKRQQSYQYERGIGLPSYGRPEPVIEFSEEEIPF